MVAGSFLFFALFWLCIASNRGILLELLSLQKSSFESAFGSLLEIQIGTDLIIAKICAFANAKRQEFAERLQSIKFCDIIKAKDAPTMPFGIGATDEAFIES